MELARMVRYKSVKCALGNSDLAIRLAFDGMDGGLIYVRPTTLTEVSVGPIEGYAGDVRQFSFEARADDGTEYVVTVAIGGALANRAFATTVSKPDGPPLRRRHA